jgi:hypothetical protein
MISIAQRKVSFKSSIKNAYEKCSNKIAEYYSRGIQVIESFTDYSDHVGFMAYLVYQKMIEIKPIFKKFIDEPTLLEKHFTGDEREYLQIKYPMLLDSMMTML